MRYEHYEPRLALAVYGRLLRLYPRSLRRQLGDEMQALFADLYADARELGRLHGAWLVLRVWWEVLPRAFQAHGDPDSPTGAYLVRSFFSDLRFAWLAATRQKRHTAVVVATMAIGIGATTAVFSVTDAAILRRLPFPEGDRLVTVAHSYPGGFQIYGLDAPAFRAWSEQTQLFDVMGGYLSSTAVTEIADEPREIHGVRISPDLLPTLGVRPVVGRMLAAEDAAEGAAPAVMISERIWEREFARDPNVEGEFLTLADELHEVAGVISDDFAFPYRRTDYWMPLDEKRDTGGSYARPLARLAPGVTLDRAEEMTTAISASLAEAQPRDEGWDVVLVPMENERTGTDMYTALVVGLAAAGLLLLVATLNVAQVALARAIQREGELAMRAALGAGRGRIIRQVLFESLMLSLVGGAAGVLLAYFLVAGIATAAPDDMVGIDSIRIAVEWRAIAVALALSVTTGVVAGLLPAWSASRRGDAAAMKQRQRGLSVSRGRRRAQSTLIVAEAALCLVLLAGAGLLLNSFERLTSVDPGFDPEPLVSMVMNLDEDRYPTPEARLTMLERLKERVARLPSVESVTFGGDAAPVPGGVRLMQGLENDAGETIDDGVISPIGLITDGFFETTGVELLDGRPLTETDYGTGNVIVAEPLARRLFGEGNALGRRFRGTGEEEWSTIVGVVRPTAAFDLASTEDDYQIYMPFKAEHRPRAYTALIVRAQGDPAGLPSVLERELWQIDSQQAVSRFELGTETMAEWVVDTRFNAVVFGTFAGVALVLVLVGIGGVVGHAVAARTREIGIRVALGASKRSILGMATLGGLRPVFLGLVLGSFAVWQTTHLISTLLYGVEPMDPVTMLAVAAVFLVATFFASYVPARRALRVDPMQALRTE